MWRKEPFEIRNGDWFYETAVPRLFSSYYVLGFSSYGNAMDRCAYAGQEYADNLTYVTTVVLFLKY